MNPDVVAVASVVPLTSQRAGFHGSAETVKQLKEARLSSSLFL